MFGIVWVYNKVMNTPSMIVTPSTILLQPHVDRFHASDQEKILIFCQLSGKFGHQVVVYHHVGATILIVPHCIFKQEGDRHL